MTIEYRWADGQNDQLPLMAADLVRRGVNVMVTGGTPATLAAKAATTTIPIAFLVATILVELGLVASLARPGGNLTGISFLSIELAAKRLELLRELVPAATRIAVLVNPANPANAESTVRDVETAARAMGLQIQVLNASNGREIDAAFTSLARDRPDALFAGPDQLFTLRRAQLVQLAARFTVRATYSTRHFVDIGGLMTYGTNTADCIIRSASMQAASSKALSPPTCQSSSRLVSNSSSISRRPGARPNRAAAAARRADEVIE